MVGAGKKVVLRVGLKVCSEFLDTFPLVSFRNTVVLSVFCTS